MKQKALLASVLLLLLLAAPPLAAQDEGTDDTDKSDTEISLEVGAWNADTEDSELRAAEYESTDGGPQLGLLIRSQQPWGHFFVSADVRDGDDQDASFEFDLGRAVRSTTEWTQLPHRLVHDPLSNLASATDHGRVVTHTDFDPRAVYGITYELLTHRTEVQMPALPALTFAVGVRNQERHGTRQSLAISHCEACHVNSQSRRVDQRTTDLSLEAQWAGSWGSLTGSVTQRELRQDPRALTLLYDDALQPELRIPIFDNRLQWDSAEGPQLVDATPDVDKDVVRLDLLLPDVGGFALTAGGVWSETENLYSNLSMDYNGYVATAFRPLGPSWDVRWRGRTYTIDNDEVFVDVNDRIGAAGPQAGSTWGEIYDYVTDYLRLSAANRDVVQSSLDVGWRLPSKKAGRIVFSWDFENVDREYYQVAPGQTDTTENVYGVSWRARPAKGWRLDARYKHGAVDNPFLNLDGQYSLHTGLPTSSPFAPVADQYFVFQDARIADVTALPETWDEARLGVTKTFGKAMLTGSYRWWDGDNDGGDLTDWSRTTQAVNASLWMAPAPTWDWYVAYAWNDAELDAPASIPIFDG